MKLKKLTKYSWAGCELIDAIWRLKSEEENMKRYETLTHGVYSKLERR